MPRDKLLLAWQAMSLDERAGLLRKTVEVLERTGIAPRYPRQIKAWKAWLEEYERSRELVGPQAT